MNIDSRSGNVKFQFFFTVYLFSSQAFALRSACRILYLCSKMRLSIVQRLLGQAARKKSHKASDDKILLKLFVLIDFFHVVREKPDIRLPG